jgi:hypothetical protein
VQFKVTRHSGFTPPADALELLWERLDGKHDEVSFTKVGGEIRAAWEEDAPVTMERDEREEIGRLAVFHLVRDVCEGAPELKLDWYAVSPLG